MSRTSPSVRGKDKMSRGHELNASKRSAMPAAAWCAMVVMLTWIVFLPALKFPFIPHWDDDIHIHANPLLMDLSWGNVWVFWKQPWQQLYIPATYSVWSGLAVLSRWASGVSLSSGELNPVWFHGANVLLHGFSAALAFVLLRRVLGALFTSAPEGRRNFAAAVGALLFALHPMQIEPVAWASGLRDVLGGMLSLAALTVLFGGERRFYWRWIGASILFLLALASKPSATVLPVIAGVLAFVPFHWSPRRMAFSIGPWLLCSTLWILLTSQAQWAAGMASGLVSVWLRPLIATDALAFYFGKLVLPINLSIDYCRSPDRVLSEGWLWWTWVFPLAVFAFIFLKKSLRIYLLPFVLFVIALLPVLGLMPFNFQITSTVADRYVYFAMLGPALAVGILMVRTEHRVVVDAACTFVVLVFAFLTLRHLPAWADDLRLFSDTLKKFPHSFKAMHNYASALDDRGRSEEAELLLRKVITMRPDNAEAYNDLAVVLWNLNRPIEAVALEQRALTIRPSLAIASNLITMGKTLGKVEIEVQGLRALISLDSSNAAASERLSQLLKLVPSDQKLFLNNE